MQGKKKIEIGKRHLWQLPTSNFPLKKTRGKNEIYPTNEQIFASFYFIFYIF